MADSATPEPRLARSSPARIGISLLNLIQPGLGLVRISRFRAALLVFGVQVLVLAVLIAIYAFAPELSASRYVRLLGTTAAFFLLVFGTSITLTWRWSKEVPAHPHWLSRWYGIVGLWILLQAIFWPVPDWVRSYYHPYYAPSESMAPSIEQNDRFVAHMRDYDPVKRGDVVIVRTHSGQEWVKRVAAIPGDRIAMRGGLVVLNGAALAQQKLGSEARNRVGAPPETVARLREQFPGEARSHEVFDTMTSAWDDTNEVTLGPGQYFLLGDNRDNSADSRQAGDMIGLGVVKREQITGRVLFRVWRSDLGLSLAPL